MPPFHSVTQGADGLAPSGERKVRLAKEPLRDAIVHRFATMKYPARHLLPSAEGEHVSRPNAYWALTTLLALSLALTAGCSSKGSKARYATPAVGSNCFAKAVPTTGEGGLAWGQYPEHCAAKIHEQLHTLCRPLGGRTSNLPSSDGQVQELKV